MKSLPSFLSLLGVVAASAYGLAGCGGDEITCGTGTVREGDTCVPEATCGTGTTLQDGECVPDGSVICEQGTVFDMTTGTCVVDPSACAAGTVLVGGECVPEDETLTADLDEAAEPNDDTGAGAFDVPALNEDITIHGCITPRAGAADSDAWIMTATGPTLLEITADGVGGLAAGFIVQDLSIAQLPNYSRFGINLAGDTSRRQVYLPVAGDYLLVMDDSRALLLGEAAGGDGTCYYGTIKTVPMPAATAATLPQTTGEDAGNVRVLSYQADQIADIIDMTQTTTSASMLPAFIVRKNGQFHASAAYDQTNDVPPFYSVGGLNTTDTVEIVVDEIYNFALSPQPYTFDFIDIAAQPLPTDGSAATVTKKNDTLPNTPWWEWNFLYFDVATAGQVVHFDLTSSAPAAMVIVRADVFTLTGAFDAMARIDLTTADTEEFSGEYIRFARPGRYYFMALDVEGTGGDTYTITSTLVATTPSAVTYGTALTGQALPAEGSGFHSLDLPVTTWIQAGVPTAADWGGDADIQLYDLAGEGWLDVDYNPVQTSTVAVDGSTVLERITRSDNRDWLVRVTPTGAPGTSPTYTLDIEERPHAVLGEAMPGTPITRSGMDSLMAGQSKGFIVDGTNGNQMTAVITPSDAGADITAARRNISGGVIGSVIDAGGDGEAETVQAVFGTMPAYHAFVVENVSASTTTDLSFNITALAPRPYTVSTGTLTYTDACTGTGSSTLPAPFDGSGDDQFSAVQTLPAGFDFRFFGFPADQFVVGANGFITFGATSPSCSFGCYNNTTMPNTAAPNGIVAGYWDDLRRMTVCRKDEATKVTLQYTGELWEDSDVAVEFQIVLNMNGNIDLIYGPGHEADGTSGDGATVGIESANASLFNLVAFNQNLIAPSTSHTFTPAP
ncbi:MAG: hypothetical protein F9K40_04550 [Kofleriaceae bacterium]|nr:MAG: hypothetical protein F9K40_04550 [Kofleriaceae bacterium]